MHSAGRACILLPLLALGLQGCVAAVIPLAAAGTMATTVEDRPQTPEVETRLSAGLEVEDASLEKAMVSAEPMASAVPAAPIDAAPTGVFAGFADYALDLAARDPLADDIRPSALLASPDILAPDRAPCRFNGTAVLIDLDPEGGVLDTEAGTSPSGLADQLGRLRAKDIQIVWSTALTADRAGDVRTWLRSSGLDPTGADRLLLLRYPDDRKQTRREEAARDRCLVAMLGDERSDFDELFDYLKKPGAAAGLNSMLGQGWFLAPIPAEGRNP